MFFKKAKRSTQRKRPRSVTTQKSNTKSRRWLKWLGWFAGLGAAAAVSGVSLGLIIFSVIYSQLPPIDSLTEYKPKVPLRVWSADGTLIGEYGEERRDFVHLDEIPSFVKNAVLAAEDNGFYEHSGIEFMGIARAALSNLLTGRRGQGGSTITMQVARNFFLSSERTYTRKLYEVAMAYKIERHLTKDQILEVYLNQIYLDHKQLYTTMLPEGFAWFSPRTVDDLFHAGEFIRVVQQSTGTKIASIEEIAYRKGWIGRAQLLSLASKIAKTEYGKYLEGIALSTATVGTK